MVKKLLRAFRASLKRQFNELSGKKHYHWVDTSLRIITLQFFTALSEQDINIEFYKQNEEAFFKLVHNTWDSKTSKKSKKTYDGGDMKRMAITGVYKEVFGQHPNKKNLKLLLQPISKLFFQTPLVNAFIFGSFFYHDYIWYPMEGWKRVEKWLHGTEWGELFLQYGDPFAQEHRKGLKRLVPGLN